MGEIDWDSVRREILDILYEQGISAAGQAAGDFAEFANAIAGKAARCVERLAADPDSAAIRRDLQYLKQEAIVLVNRMGIRWESNGLRIFEEILSTAVRALLKGLVLALGG